MILASALVAFGAALVADRPLQRLAFRSGGDRGLIPGLALIYVVHHGPESGWRVIARPGRRSAAIALAVAAAFAVSAGLSGRPSLAVGLALALGGALSNHLESIRSGARLTGRRAVVLDVGPLDLVDETYAAGSSGASDVGHAVYEGTLVQAEAGVALARQAGFDAEPRAAVDAPTWRGIIDVANEIDAAVIVLGSDGRTGLTELLEGSVSHDVAEHAHRPVLIAPPAPTSSDA